MTVVEGVEETGGFRVAREEPPVECPGQVELLVPARRGRRTGRRRVRVQRRQAEGVGEAYGDAEVGTGRAEAPSQAGIEDQCRRQLVAGANRDGPLRCAGAGLLQGSQLAKDQQARAEERPVHGETGGPLGLGGRAGLVGGRRHRRVRVHSDRPPAASADRLERHHGILAAEPADRERQIRPERQRGRPRSFAKKVLQREQADPGQPPGGGADFVERRQRHRQAHFPTRAQSVGELGVVRWSRLSSSPPACTAGRARTRSDRPGAHPRRASAGRRPGCGSRSAPRAGW